MTKAEYFEISIWEVNNSVSTHLDFGAHILDNYLTSFMNKKMRYCNPFGEMLFQNLAELIFEGVE